jgi:hypothetical protein
MTAQDADEILGIRPSWSRSFECRGDERAKTKGGARVATPPDNCASASRTARLCVVASTSLLSVRYKPERSL